MKFSKLWYYGRSVITLLLGFRRPFQIIAIFLGRPGALPAEVQLRRSGWRFQIRSAMDAWIIKETCLDADYLKPVGALESNWTVMDIGAGLGDFTILAAKQCPEGVVYAYEPLPDSFALLERNLTLNNVSNVRAFPAAVASRSASLIVDSSEVEAVSTRFVEDDNATGFVALSFTEMLAKLPDGRCHFLKIDCEGCEFDLLLNSDAATLARIERISMEYHNGFTINNSEELANHLRSHGFKVQQQSNPIHDYLGFLYAERP